jgi:4a-hydroxytetrahydrobiopterin dehydratase
MPEKLTERSPKEYPRGTPPIEENRAAELQQQLDPSWERDGNKRLRRQFTFENFRDAFGFLTRIALIAESEGHHPECEVGWGRVVVVLYTHTAEGLTDNDFIVAAKIDSL